MRVTSSPSLSLAALTVDAKPTPAVQIAGVYVAPIMTHEKESHMNKFNADLFASRTIGNGWGVYTKDGSHSALDHSAPGIHAEGNATLFANAPDMASALEAAKVALTLLSACASDYAKTDQRLAGAINSALAARNGAAAVLSRVGFAS